MAGMVFTEAMRGMGGMGGLGDLVGDWLILFRGLESCQEEVAPKSVTRMVMAMAAATTCLIPKNLAWRG